MVPFTVLRQAVHSLRSGPAGTPLAIRKDIIGTKKFFYSLAAILEAHRFHFAFHVFPSVLTHTRSSSFTISKTVVDAAAPSGFDFMLLYASAALASISDTWASAWLGERRGRPPIIVR